MGQILRLVEREGGRSGFVYERYVSEAFVRGLSLKEYLERVHHTDPAKAVTEILPFHPADLVGSDEAA